LQPDDDLAERLLPALLLGERGLELFRRNRLRLDEQLAEPRAAPVAIEDRQELVARDHLLGDEDLAEQHVRLRLTLHAQRLLHLGRGGEPLGHEQVAEPERDRLTARRAVPDGRRTAAVERDQSRRIDLGTRCRSHWPFEEATEMPRRGARQARENLRVRFPEPRARAQIFWSIFCRW